MASPGPPLTLPQRGLVIRGVISERLLVGLPAPGGEAGGLDFGWRSESSSGERIGTAEAVSSLSFIKRAGGGAERCSALSEGVR